VPMWSILHMTVTSLVVVVASRTGKIIKNGLLKFATKWYTTLCI